MPCGGHLLFDMLRRAVLARFSEPDQSRQSGFLLGAFLAVSLAGAGRLSVDRDARVKVRDFPLCMEVRDED